VIPIVRWLQPSFEHRAARIFSVMERSSGARGNATMRSRKPECRGDHLCCAYPIAARRQSAALWASWVGEIIYGPWEY